MAKEKLIQLEDDPQYKLKNEWAEKLRKQLVGKTILNVRYMATQELDGWYKAPIIIELNDGQALIPQMDDEGNDGGALYICNPPKGGGSLAPVIY